MDRSTYIYKVVDKWLMIDLILYRELKWVVIGGKGESGKGVGESRGFGINLTL